MQKDKVLFPLLKPYEPKPHPMQHRVDSYRSVPSLVTGGR
jgi:hypothetical protein